jgi:hypothetical protein
MGRVEIKQAYKIRNAGKILLQKRKSKRSFKRFISRDKIETIMRVY